MVDKEFIRKDKVQTKYDKAHTVTKICVTWLLSVASNANIATSETEINRLGALTLKDFSLYKVPELRSFIFIRIFSTLKNVLTKHVYFPIKVHFTSLYKEQHRVGMLSFYF